MTDGVGNVVGPGLGTFPENGTREERIAWLHAANGRSSGNGDGTNPPKPPDPKLTAKPSVSTSGVFEPGKLAKARATIGGGDQGPPKKKEKIRSLDELRSLTAERLKVLAGGLTDFIIQGYHHSEKVWGWGVVKPGEPDPPERYFRVHLVEISEGVYEIRGINDRAISRVFRILKSLDFIRLNDEINRKHNKVKSLKELREISSDKFKELTLKMDEFVIVGRRGKDASQISSWQVVEPIDAGFNPDYFQISMTKMSKGICEVTACRGFRAIEVLDALTSHSFIKVRKGVREGFGSRRSLSSRMPLFSLEKLEAVRIENLERWAGERKAFVVQGRLLDGSVTSWEFADPDKAKFVEGSFQVTLKKKSTKTFEIIDADGDDALAIVDAFKRSKTISAQKGVRERLNARPVSVDEMRTATRDRVELWADSKREFVLVGQMIGREIEKATVRNWHVRDGINEEEHTSYFQILVRRTRTRGYEVVSGRGFDAYQAAKVLGENSLFKVSDEVMDEIEANDPLRPQSVEGEVNLMGDFEIVTTKELEGWSKRRRRFVLFGRVARGDHVHSFKALSPGQVSYKKQNLYIWIERLSETEFVVYDFKGRGAAMAAYLLEKSGSATIHPDIENRLRHALLLGTGEKQFPLRKLKSTELKTLQEWADGREEFLIAGNLLTGDIISGWKILKPGEVSFGEGCFQLKVMRISSRQYRIVDITGQGRQKVTKALNTSRFITLSDNVEDDLREYARLTRLIARNKRRAGSKGKGGQTGGRRRAAKWVGDSSVGLSNPSEIRLRPRVPRPGSFLVTKSPRHQVTHKPSLRGRDDRSNLVDSSGSPRPFGARDDNRGLGQVLARLFFAGRSDLRDVLQETELTPEQRGELARTSGATLIATAERIVEELSSRSSSHQVIESSSHKTKAGHLGRAAGTARQVVNPALMGK